MSPQEYVDFCKRMEKEDPEGWKRASLPDPSEVEDNKAQKKAEDVGAGLCGCIMIIFGLGICIPLMIWLWRMALSPMGV